jgi:hypothetical protein
VALATKGATRGQAAHDTVVTGRRLRWPASIGTEAQGYLPERAAGLTPNLERRNLHSFISTSALVAAAGGSAAAVEAYAEMAELFWGRLVLRSEEQDEAAAEEAALQASMQRATRQGQAAMANSVAGTRRRSTRNTC